MNWLDIVLIVWLTSSVITGVRLGFVYKFGSLIGLVIGMFLASAWTPDIAEPLGGGAIATAGVFLIILGLLSKFFGLFAKIIDKLFKFVTLIPGLKTMNRVLGGLIGLLITVIIASAGLYIADEFSGGDEISETIEASQVGSTLERLSVFYGPFLSSSLEEYLDEKTKPKKPERKQLKHGQ